ncbi:MAG: YtxH domain-containing protein [Clostridium sp.]|nr:YtxH domain-containing protein [Prevotella sp.]MCM1429705.1 YtxH domain-containing protein [Clostridium sp.]MCM1474631.1 YtxH domain-containing protein [Muribaculaceae bacterium]
MKAIHVICAVVGGAIAGATLGLLLAPENGKDTRKKIADVLKSKGIRLKKDKMDELVDEIEDQIEEHI